MTDERLQLQASPPAAPCDDDDAPCCLDRDPIISVERLSAAYDGTLALRDVTLPIYKGCLTAIVGPSGCGKSTFLTCLNRLTDLSPGCAVTGSIRVDDEEIVGAPIDLLSLRRRVGMIFQKPNPFPLSIRRNLTFPLKQHGMRDRRKRHAAAEQILQRVGLWDEVKDRLDAPAHTLSGGQQQRLCLARTLVLKPEVILFDEPCSALDPGASGLVEDLIRSLRGRFTVVIVTHNIAQARRIADDVAVFWMRDGAGEIVERGAAKTVFSRPRSPVTADYLAGVRG